MEEAEQIGMAKPWQMGFQEPATEVMSRLDGVHDGLMIVVTIISLLVLGLLAYVCVRFSRKRNPIPSKNAHNTLVEVVWTVLPIMILVGIAVPSLRLHYFMAETPAPDMTLKVTGNQWNWGYEYPDHDGLSYISSMVEKKEIKEGQHYLLSTDKPVVVPVGKVVRVIMTSADVIHAWAMPAFGVKKDAVPGRLNETWFRADKPGVYYGQCSELCGVMHGFMPVELHVVEQDVFDAWVKRAKDGNYAIQDLKKPRQAALAQ